MKISIFRIVDAPIVLFRSLAGEAWGVWQGDSPPTIGSHYVEFDIPDPVLGREIPASLGSCIMGDPAGQESGIRISGVLESLDEASVGHLRVGRDIVMIELAPESQEVHVGASVEVHAKMLQLYPVDL